MRFPQKNHRAGARPRTLFTVSLVVASVSIFTLPTGRANTPDSFQTGTDLDTAANYSITTALPTSANDVLLTSTSTALTINTANLAFGSLDVTNGTTYSIADNGTTNNYTLTLGSTTLNNTVTGANPSDLIFLSGSSNLTITGIGSNSKTLGVVLAGSGNLDVGSGSTLAISSIISGTGFSLTNTGAGTVALAGTNSFSGGFTMNTGTMDLNSTEAVGTGTFVINGGTIDTTNATAGLSSKNNVQTWGGDFTFAGTSSFNLGTGAVSLGTNATAARTVTVTASTLTVGGIISNGTNATTPTTTLVKAGAGTLTLSGANTFSGGLTVQTGTVSGTVAAAFGASTGTVTLGVASSGNSATLLGAGSVTFANPISLASSDSGTLTIGTTASTLSPTFSGGVTGGSSLTIANAGTGTLTFSTATINNAGTVTNAGTGIGAVTLTGGVDVNVTGVTENGTSPLILSGTNTNYDGATNLTAGTLKLGTATALGGGGSTTGTGGTLTIAAGTTLDATTSTTISTVNAENWNGSFTYGSSATLNLGTGAVTLGASSVQLTNAGGSSLTIGGGVTTLSSLSSSNLTLNATGTGSLMFTGLVNNTGTITNSGAGTGTTTLSGGVGAAVTSITENGTSPLTLSGTNTNFGGTTTLTAGTLNLNSVTALGGNGSTTGTGGALTVSGGILTGNSVLSTVNAVNLNNDFTYGSANTLVFGTSDATSLGANADTTRTITFTSTGTLNLSGVVSNATGSTGTTLIKAGTGILDLNNGTNTFSNLTVNGGTVADTTVPAAGGAYSAAASIGTPFGQGTITLNGSSISFASSTNSGSNPGYAYLANAVSLTGNGTITPGGGSKRVGIVDGLISGNGQLTVSLGGLGSTSAAVGMLSNTNTYTGGTDLDTTSNYSGGSVEYVANAANALGGGSGSTGGVLTFSNNTAVASQVPAYLILTASQSIAGLATSTVNTVGSTYVTGFSTSTATTPTLTINTASGPPSTYKGSIGGTPTLGVSYNSSNASITASAAAGNNINLVVTGSGTQVLSGTNSYTGTTMINGGTLNLNGAGTNLSGVITGGTLAGGIPTTGGTTIVPSAITVNSGTLMLAANYTLNPTTPTTLNGGILSVGNTVLQGQGATVSGGTASGTNLNGVGMLTLTSNSTLAFATATNGSGTLVFSGLTDTAGSILNVTGGNFGNSTTSADGSTERLIFATSVNTNDFTFNGIADATEVNLGGTYYEVEPLSTVPEASTWAWATMSIGAGLVTLVRRRRLAAVGAL